MKKCLLACGLITVSLSSVLARTVDWLILIDMAANNNLYSYALLNMRQLQGYGSNNYAKVIVQLTRTGGTCARYLISKGSSRLLASLGHVDSSSKSSLSSFVIYGIKNFPARKRALIIWDHGTGYVNAGDFSLGRSVCYDQTHDSWMNSVSLRDAIRTAYQSTHRVLDIIAFDACLMQMLELGTLLAPYAKYMVASQEEVPDIGFNYTLMLKPFAHGTLSVANFARQLVRDYNTLYKNTSIDYTLSAIDLQKMLLVERNCDRVAHLLISCLQKQVGNSVSTTLHHCLVTSSCLHFAIYAYIDMGRWYQTVLAHLASFNVTDASLKTSLAAALRAGLVLLSPAVVANTAAHADARALGLSICFPSYVMYPSYAHSSFASSNAWVTFVTRYLATQQRAAALCKEQVWLKKFLAHWRLRQAPRRLLYA